MPPCPVGSNEDSKRRADDGRPSRGPPTEEHDSARSIDREARDNATNNHDRALLTRFADGGWGARGAVERIPEPWI